MWEERTMGNLRAIIETHGGQQSDPGHRHHELCDGSLYCSRSVGMGPLDVWDDVGILESGCDHLLFSTGCL